MKSLTLALMLLFVSGASAQPQAQTFRTIVDRNHDNRLEYGPREGYTTRTDLAQRGSGGTPIRLIHFAQMSDIHLVDEESPARVEFIDRLGGPFIPAYRPQEGLLPFVLTESVRALRAEKPELVMLTGDSADNTQRNETRWVIDILDGGVVTAGSGIRGTCNTKKLAPAYDGVHGAGRYYEPNRSRGQDGPGYSPSERKNRRQTRRSNALRDYHGLYEEMNRPFRSPGLGVPWYVVVGNHDSLIQGNVPGSAFFSQVAVGCVKVTDLSRRAWNLIKPLAKDGITEEERVEIVRIVYGDVLATLSNKAKSRGLWERVPRDRRRALLFRKPDFMREFLRTRGRPSGHGFTQANLDGGEGYYAFSPKPGIRFLVLDSSAATGSEGNLDDPQFRWLQAELLTAEAQHELVVVFAHHSLGSMGQQENGVHYGLTGSCPSTLPATPPLPDETVRCLLLRHPSVVALVAGHSHDNRITPYARLGGGGFWEILAPAQNDWPEQSRVIDLYDNRNGTLSVLTHVVDQKSPPRPGAGQASSARLLSPAEVTRLASIARELSFNDPHAENGEDGFPDRRGTPLDRNVELLVPNPY